MCMRHALSSLRFPLAKKKRLDEETSVLSLNYGTMTIAILDFRLPIANSAQLLVMPGDIGAMARQHPF